jgi:hypothetical protein
MEFQHVNILIPVEGELPVPLEEFVPVFHRWIRENSLDEFLIDVADYAHVYNGPGMMLLGHDADYSLDHGAGIYGLLYNRKSAREGSNADRFHAAIKAASNACQLLEQEFAETGPLKFSRTTFDVIINDRAIAPNTEETLAAFLPEFEAFLNAEFDGCSFQIDQDSEPRRRFRVTVTSDQPLEFEKLS